MASGGMFDTSEMRALSADFAQVNPALLVHLRAAIQGSSLRLKNAWASNAAGTAGIHGKHYPNSITYETRILSGAGAFGEVGPESGKPQGGMGRGFEYGSVNQPPHMDGAKALDGEEPLFIAAVTQAAVNAMKPIA